MTAKTDNDRDIEDFVPGYSFLRALANLKSCLGISDYEVIDGNLYVTPRPNIEKIDLDPTKTVTLKCIPGIF